MKLKINRETSIFFKKILNNCLPPIIRDSKILMTPLFRMVLGTKAEIFLNFRQIARTIIETEFTNAYEDTQSVNLHGETDLNQASIDLILKHIIGESCVDVGSGRAYLANLISKSTDAKVTACDINQPKYLQEKYPKINFIEGNCEKLPLEDKSIDSVICTHTLEHVRDLSQAISELRRVARKRLIVVVPMERPYRFDFNLHLNFFTYPEMFLSQIQAPLDAHFENAGGDLFYFEDYKR